MKKLISILQNNAITIAFTVALTATISSLFLSEIAHLSPCKLCWYQRSLMFPLPVILGAALLLKEKRAYAYVFPLAIAGATIALYQSLLQWGIIQEDILECSLDNPCANPEILWLGFLTIPFGSFLSFTAIVALMWLARKSYGKKIDFDKNAANLIPKIVLSVVALVVLAAIIYLFNL